MGLTSAGQLQTLGLGRQDVLSFAEIYQRHLPTVWRWTHRLLGPEHAADAEDLIQDIFVIAHRQLPKFRAEAKVSTWLYGMTAKVVRDHRRKKQFRAFFVRRQEEADQHVPSRAPAAPMILETHQKHQRIYRALGRLADRSRTVLILQGIEGLSGEEIAELLDAKVSTVWVWLHRAREQFLKQYERLEREEEG